MRLKSGSTSSYLTYQTQQSTASARQTHSLTACDDSQMSRIRNSTVHVEANVLPGTRPFIAGRTD